MNWKAKLEILMRLFERRPELEMYFSVAPAAPVQFLERLRAEYPFLPNSYLELLGISDGIQLHWFVIGGSGESEFPSLEALTKRWQPRIGDRRVLPIGHDASGDAFVLTESGIELIPQPQYGEAIVLTMDFDELIGEYFLGTKYPLMFDGEPAVDDPWWALIRELGWATVK